MPARNPLTAQVTRVARIFSPLGATDGKWFTMADTLNQLPTATASDSTTVAVGTHPEFVVSSSTANAATRTFPAVLTGRGGITITTANASGDSARLRGAATSRYVNIIPSSTVAVEIEGTIRTPSAITTMAIYWGLKKTTANETYTTDADEAFFVYDTTSAGTGASLANWNTYHRVATGTPVITDLGTSYAVAVSTAYRFRIYIGTDLKPRFYINNALVRTETTALTAATTYLFVAGVISRTTATRSIDVTDIRVSSNSTT